MGLSTLEHGKVAYLADFVLYGAAVAALAAFLLLDAPPSHRVAPLALAGAGWVAWSAIEYAMHRFVLHGLAPFRGWHARHHQRPGALIGTPTLLSAALIATLVFLPALLLGSLWAACALTLGLTAGYLVYGITHHATHHGRTRGAWLKRRKRWHARHHHLETPACFGVTSAFWDHVFGSTGQVVTWRTHGGPPEHSPLIESHGGTAQRTAPDDRFAATSARRPGQRDPDRRLCRAELARVERRQPEAHRDRQEHVRPDAGGPRVSPGLAIAPVVSAMARRR